MPTPQKPILNLDNLINHYDAGEPVNELAAEVVEVQKVRSIFWPRTAYEWFEVRTRFAPNAIDADVYVVGDLPSRYVVLPTTEDAVCVYSSLEVTTQGVELEEDSRFPNVELVEVEDQTVYFDPSEEEGFPWLSALQTYLMLASGGKREQGAAGQIRPDLVEASGGGQGSQDDS